MPILVDHRDNLREDIESELFELSELASTYQCREDEIIRLAKEFRLSAIIVDISTDEYLYL